jgi:hypothetical protein
MAVYHFTTADRNAVLATLRTQWDNQSGACIIEFYDGSIIATPTTAITTQVKLGTLTCTDPLGSEASGVLTFDPITQDTSADATGTCTWALLKDGGGNPRAVFDVTNNAGTGAIKMNTTSIVALGPIQMSAFTITAAGA